MTSKILVFSGRLRNHSSYEAAPVTLSQPFCTSADGSNSNSKGKSTCCAGEPSTLVLAQWLIPTIAGHVDACSNLSATSYSGFKGPP